MIKYNILFVKFILCKLTSILINFLYSLQAKQKEPRVQIEGRHSQKVKQL